jgi:hypothetical protein
MFDVILNQMGCVNYAANSCASWAIPWFVESVFDCIFNVIIKFVAAAREKFDSVVGHRVVTSRKHDANVCASAASEECDCWSWRNTNEQNINASARQTCNNCSFEELATYPRIASDNCSGAMASESASISQYVCSSNGEIKGKFCSEIAIS